MKKWTNKEDKLLKEAVASQQNLKGVCRALRLSKYLVEKRMDELGLDFSQDEIKLTQIKQADRTYRQRYEDAVSRITDLEQALKAQTSLDGVSIKPYKIKPVKLSNTSEAVAVALLSDWHYEEVVKPQSVNHLNEFNEAVAQSRLKQVFITIVKYLNLHKRETHIERMVLALLGDFISGGIHDELKESNTLLPIEAIWKVQNHIASGINYILENTDVKLTIPCSPGNHCVTDDTEILTDKGWKKAKNISEDDIVASFSKESGVISYDKAEALEKFQARGAYKIKGKHKNEIVTPKHNLVIGGNFMRAEDYVGGYRDDFRHAGFINGSGINLSSNELRLLTWVVMDGTLVDNAKYVKGSTKKRVQFKLSKKRKIDSLCELLDRMKIKYSIKKATMSETNILQPYLIRIYGDWARKIFSMLNDEKVLPKSFKDLSREQLITVLKTIQITDGRESGDSIEWSSICKQNIDIIQIACITNGIPCKFKTYKEFGGFENRKTLYVANIYINGFNVNKVQKVENVYTNRKFNFVGIQTKNGTIITRRQGVVNFTGNSRITVKQRVATDHGNSLEWLMYLNLAEHYKGNDRVEFVVNEGYHTYLDIYDFTIRFHHGQALRYQGGVGGIYIPVNKAINQWNKSKRADLDCFGHFHQMKNAGTFISNGSLIGWNSFAIRIKADFEKPKQAFFLVDKKYFVNCIRPIVLNGA
jgi:hypothetical protein